MFTPSAKLVRTSLCVLRNGCVRQEPGSRSKPTFPEELYQQGEAVLQISAGEWSHHASQLCKLVAEPVLRNVHLVIQLLASAQSRTRREGI